MTANDNDHNVVKLVRKEKKEEPKKTKPQKQIVANVSLQGRDIALYFPGPDFELLLKPRAAFEMAMLLLTAIKAGADKYIPKDKE